MSHGAEVRGGERFAFGDNWREFLSLVNDDRIATAEKSVVDMLGRSDLTGCRFLDVGSGSGLFSLAARNLGAVVTSFDYDPSSVACTKELKQRYRPDDDKWLVMEGSALDEDFIESLGAFDIVYSWGVLHHTGDMWRALDLVARTVAVGGRIFLSIYNDQGRSSRMWLKVKKRYVEGGPLARGVLVQGANAMFKGRALPFRLYGRLRGSKPERTPRARGMDARRDLVDWVGGYPFEVAKPEEIFGFFRDRGFRLDELTTCGGGLGCNQFVLTRTD